jgi:phage FluMu protein Com
MQIHCYNCHKPFAIGKDAVSAALEQISGGEIHHLDVPCPHCRRVNRVSKDELARFAPAQGKQEKEET